MTPTTSTPSELGAASCSAFGDGPAPFVWDYQPETHNDPHACRIGDWLMDDYNPIASIREVPVKGGDHRMLYFRLCAIPLPERTPENVSPSELWAKLVKVQELPEKRRIEHLHRILVWVRIG
jgi:hypothetical protein